MATEDIEFINIDELSVSGDIRALFEAMLEQLKWSLCRNKKTGRIFFYTPEDWQDT
jgi:hypothetical protein